MRIIQRLASAYCCLDERRCLIDSASRVWIWVLLEPIGCGRCVSLASRRLGAKVVQCRIGVGGGCSLTRTPPSYTPVQNQACIPRVWMAVRYPGSPLPRPLGESVRRGDESPLWMGPDVYAGTLPASPLHPHQRGGHPPFFRLLGGGCLVRLDLLCLEKLSVRAADGRACVLGVPPRAS